MYECVYILKYLTQKRMRAPGFEPGLKALCRSAFFYEKKERIGVKERKNEGLLMQSLLSFLFRQRFSFL